MITTIRCNPARPGHIRSWHVTQILAGRKTEQDVLAATGRQALEIAHATLMRGVDLKTRITDLEAA